MLKFFLIIAIATLVILLIFLWRVNYKKPSENYNTKISVAHNDFLVEIADSSLKRAQGLSGRLNLNSGQGMLFIFDVAHAYTFWMRGMHFPIDIIWINDDKVIGFDENLPPDSGLNPKLYSPPSAADKVLEIKAGEVQRLGIKIGDSVSKE